MLVASMPIAMLFSPGIDVEYWIYFKIKRLYDFNKNGHRHGDGFPKIKTGSEIFTFIFKDKKLINGIGSGQVTVKRHIFFYLDINECEILSNFTLKYKLKVFR